MPGAQKRRFSTSFINEHASGHFVMHASNFVNETRHAIAIARSTILERNEGTAVLAAHVLAVFAHRMTLLWPYLQTTVFVLKLATSIVEFLSALPGGSSLVTFLDSLANFGWANDLSGGMIGFVVLTLAKTLHHATPPASTFVHHGAVIHVDHPSQTLFTIVDNFDYEGEAPSSTTKLAASDSDDDYSDEE